MTTERFRFREDVLHAAASRLRRRFALTLAATGAIVVLVWATALRAQGAGPGTLAFSVVFLLGVATLSLRRRMRRLHARWDSFAVTIEGERVVREVAGFRPLSIARADVEAIEERAEGIVVRGRGGQVLLVPRDLDGYARARAALAAWRPAQG